MSTSSEESEGDSNGKLQLSNNKSIARVAVEFGLSPKFTVVQQNHYHS